MVRWRTAALLVVALALGFVAWRRFPSGLWPQPPTHRIREPAPPPPVSDPEQVSRARFPGHVADGARMLPLFSHTLEHMAQTWSDDLGIDFQVVTLADPDHPVEVLAPKVFQVRRIGGDSPVGGILVLLDPVRGEARIEVSYTLEGAFPDALVGRIAHDQLAPYASYRLAGMAVMDGIHQLKDWAWLQSARGTIALPDSYKAREAFRSRMRFLSGGAGAQVRLADFPVDRDLKARVPAARRARYAPSSDPRASAEAFQRVLQDLAGDPSLELFTEGSRIMRASYPMAPFESFERAARLEDSKPLRAIVQGDRAVVTSDHPVHGFVPVLLVRQGGLWHVDMVETWKNLFFDWDGNYHLANSNTPYAFGLAAYGSADAKDVAAFPGLDGDRLPAVLARLEKTPGPVAAFVRGEILFRNCFVFVEALHAYEQAVDKAPQDALFLDTLADRALYLGFPELAAQTYRKMSPQPHLAISRALAQAEDLPGAEEEARQAVSRNPYDPEALRQLEWTLRREKKEGEAAEVAGTLQTLAKDRDRRWAPVTLSFDPPNPVLVTASPMMSQGQAVYDHSTFSVTMTNPSARSVVIDQVRLISVGTGHPSGLGEIRDYWKYPAGGHVLGPGESVSFWRLWGYVVETRQQQVSYIFDYCWHGRASGKRQCRDERIDTFAH
jgi:tetratricopeptide (TPR) repeat protein